MSRLQRVTVTAVFVVVFAGATACTIDKSSIDKSSIDKSSSAKTRSDKSALPVTVITSTAPATSDALAAPVTVEEFIPEYLDSDIATVKAVARVSLAGRKVTEEFAADNQPDANCGYAGVSAGAKILEVFKGSLTVGDTIEVGWVIECPFDVESLFLGERIVFIDPPEKAAGSWVALENSTLPATPGVIEKLRELTNRS